MIIFIFWKYILFKLEYQMEEKQTYTSQLQTIKAIEQNLNLLKTRIGFLQKQQLRTAQNFSKLFQSSVPVIRSKINQAQTENRNKAIHYIQARSKNKREEQIKQNRINHLVQLSKSKIQVKTQKINGSFHIKELSKKNQQIIDEAKKQRLEEKKKKTQLIRSYKQESRRKVEQYHIQKQKQFQRAKQEEKKQLENRINKITKQLVKMMRIQQKQSQRYKNNDESVRNLKRILLYLQHMKHEQFEKILRKVDISAESPLDDDVVQYILQQTQKIRQNKYEPGAKARFSLYEQMNLLKRRHESQSLDINAIYGQRISGKKVR